MIELEKIFRLLFVKPFYTENAGVFVLVFTMMFVIVGSTHGYGLYAYHRSLAVGMLGNTGFLLGVFAVWFLYVRKYEWHIAETITQPAFGFIDIFNRLHKGRQFLLFATVQLWLLLPIILYAAFVIYIGIQEKYYLPIVWMVLYLLLLCTAVAAWLVYRLDNLNKGFAFPWQQRSRNRINFSAYTFILLGFVAKKQKVVWAGIKVFTCGIVYLVARNNSATAYDISLPFLFFNFGILANGVVIYRSREFENIYLSFYRGLPVSLAKRFFQYTIFWFFAKISGSA